MPRNKTTEKITVTFVGLTEEDIKETETLHAHSRINGALLFRLLLKVYRATFIRDIPRT